MTTSQMFTPEELEMMGGAVEVSNLTAATASTSEMDEIETRLRSLARFIAEGSERERLLRRALLEAGGRDPLGPHADHLYDQMEQLTKMVLSGLERERTLRRQVA
jgi:hypothetical protein